MTNGAMMRPERQPSSTSTCVQGQRESARTRETHVYRDRHEEEREAGHEQEEARHVDLPEELARDGAGLGGLPRSDDTVQSARVTRAPLQEREDRDDGRDEDRHDDGEADRSAGRRAAQRRTCHSPSASPGRR